MIEKKFTDWWWHYGSGIRPRQGDDMETHARHVSQRAYRAGFQSRLFEVQSWKAVAIGSWAMVILVWLAKF